MKTVAQLLAEKGDRLVAVAPDDKVFHALSLMSQHDVGAVLVLDGEQLAGIFSERDYARKLMLYGRSAHTMPVRDMMTARVVCAAPDQTLAECVRTMTEMRFRHLPVVAAGKVVGLISATDLIRESLARQPASTC